MKDKNVTDNIVIYINKIDRKV